MKRLYFGLVIVAVVIGLFVIFKNEKQPVEPRGPEQVSEKPLPTQKLKEPTPEMFEQLSAVIGKPVSIRHMTLITDFRTQKKVGDVVRFEAKPMGSMTPFSATEASFIVGDELTIASCDLLSGDPRCETPWDTHREEPEAIAAGTVVIQIVDANGKVIPASAKGVNGLKELRRLRISGKIVEMRPGQYPVIQAEAIQFLD